MERSTVHTEIIENLIIKIFPDDDAPNPIKDLDCAAQMVCWHRRYDLGHEHDFEDREDFLKQAKKGRWEWLPLYLYDHSGITMSTGPFSCGWDSGQVGYIYIDPETGRKEWGRLWRQKARDYMQATVEEYDNYLTGTVYGFVVEDLNTEEEIHACWGFLGHYEAKAKDGHEYGALIEARGEAIAHLKWEADQAAKCAAITHL